MSFGRGKDESDKPVGAFSIGAIGSSAATSSGGVSGSQVEAFLGRGSKVVGTLNFGGPADLDGHVEGEINARERLTIGEGATINAKINGTEIVVKGNVNGDIVATKRLSLKKPARVTGNLSAATLSIEEGVVFEGKCAMAVEPRAGESRPGDSKSSDGKSSDGRPAVATKAAG
jgi:cytoskeletal protein CcmA (bactofilin family)